MKIAIIGDWSPAYPSQQATNDALLHSAAKLGIQLAYDWIPTTVIPAQLEAISKLYNGFWIAPGIPESLDGVLQLIRRAREQQIPLIGTCGGFQSIIMEYARNELRLAHAEHEERTPDAALPVISKLACSLAGQTGEVLLVKPSFVHDVYQQQTVAEPFRCSYGLNPAYAAQLDAAGLRIVGADAAGQPRIVQLSGHPFFIGTLFVPQLRSTSAHPHCLIDAFIAHASRSG